MSKKAILENISIINKAEKPFETNFELVVCVKNGKKTHSNMTYAQAVESLSNLISNSQHCETSYISDYTISKVIKDEDGDVISSTINIKNRDENEIMSKQDISVTDTQLFLSINHEEKKLNFSINYVINDTYLLQYDSEKGFSIPDSDQQFWNDKDKQDVANKLLAPNFLAKFLNLPTTLEDLFNEFDPEIFGDAEEKEMLGVE